MLVEGTLSSLKPCLMQFSKPRPINTKVHPAPCQSGHAPMLCSVHCRRSSTTVMSTQPCARPSSTATTRPTCHLRASVRVCASVCVCTCTAQRVSMFRERSICAAARPLGFCLCGGRHIISAHACRPVRTPALVQPGKNTLVQLYL